VVAFAGKDGGERFVSVDHPDGVRTTYSWLSSIAVKKGDHVRTGQVLASTGLGHPGAITPHIHLGAKFDGDYIDPIGLFGPMDLSDIIRLAPVWSTGRPPPWRHLTLRSSVDIRRSTYQATCQE
jgi:murein DD-endopeptidase MepM/ murein hydrolase activator NlpD